MTNDTPPSWLSTGYILLFVLLPWSVDVDFGAWNLTLPSEPLILLLGLALARELLSSPARLLKSGRAAFQVVPVTISLLWILWMAVAACFSSMQTVSLKYWLVEAGHWWVFAVGISLYPGLWRRVLPYFALSMLGVAVFTIIHHGMLHFRADQALLAPMPFFPDHTLYASVLAMLVFFIPAVAGTGADRVGVFFQKSWVRNGLTAFLGTALMLSTCRAAVLSAVLAGIVLFLYKWRKQPFILTACIVLLGITGYSVREKITRTLYNDISFQERLNRWDCAASMLAARPVTGFGPGTYPFQYLPFQQPEKMTRISAREPVLERGPDTYGRGGGAHSEYWQAASELGWPGLLLWTTLLVAVFWAGWQRSRQSISDARSIPVLWITLGLFTFCAHTLANNFLHDGRVAALVWGSMMYLVAGVQSSRSSSRNSQHFPSG